MLEEPTTLPIMATAVPKGRREKAPEEGGGGIKKRKHGYYGYPSSSSILLRETELSPRPFLCPDPHTEDKPSGQPRQPEQRTKGSFPKIKIKKKGHLYFGLARTAGNASWKPAWPAPRSPSAIGDSVSTLQTPNPAGASKYDAGKGASETRPSLGPEAQRAGSAPGRPREKEPPLGQRRTPRAGGEDTVTRAPRRRPGAPHIKDATAHTVEKTAGEGDPVRRCAEKRRALGAAPPRFSQRPGESPQCACATTARGGGEKNLFPSL